MLLLPEMAASLWSDYRDYLVHYWFFEDAFDWYFGMHLLWPTPYDHRFCKQLPMQAVSKQKKEL